MTIHSRLVDAHIYLIKRWVINFLCHNEGFSTIKGELLPYIIRKQLSKSGPGAVDGDNPFSTTISDDKSDDIFSVSYKLSENKSGFDVNVLNFSSSSKRICKPRSVKLLCSMTQVPEELITPIGFDATQVGRPKMYSAFE